MCGILYRPTLPLFQGFPVLTRRLVSWTLPVLLSTGCLSGSTTVGVQHVYVEERATPAPVTATVAQVLRRAGARVPEGHYLAAVSHRRLGPNGRPGRVLVNGRPVGMDTVVTRGAHVTIQPGPDVREPLQAIVVTAPPLQASMYVGGRSGSTRVIRGKVSHEQVARRPLAAASRGHLIAPGALALTFDDGPDPVWTPRILAILARAHVHATFCLVGREAAAHPELVRAIVAGGHALCDHTWDHDEQLGSRPPDVARGNIARAFAAITVAGGVQPLFYRAPGGNWTPAVEREARRQGLSPLHWTVDTRDWSKPGTQSILKTAYRQVRPGGVILLHDGGGDRSQTVAALPVLVRRLQLRHFHFLLPRP